MEYQLVTCKKCGATLRLPKANDYSAVTCPKCKCNLQFYSGKKQSGGHTLSILMLCSAFILLAGIAENQPAIEITFGILSLVLFLCAIRSGKDTTFNIIKNHAGGHVDRCFRAIALINSAGHNCTGISICRKYTGYRDRFDFTATFQWIGSTLTYLGDFLTRENERIEREFQSKTKGHYGTSDAEIQVIHRAWKEADKERQRLQDLADDEFFKTLLGQLDTASNRELVVSPFHCFASSHGQYIIDEDFWVIAPGGEGSLYKGCFISISKREPENKGYNGKYAVSALEKLIAQYGLNVPITQNINPQP